MFNVGEYQNDIGIQCHISLPHKSDFLDGKTTTDEGFDFILLHAKKLCINAYGTNLSLHLKLL